MDDVKRYVNLAFIGAFMIMAWLLVESISLGMATATLPDPTYIHGLIRLSTLIGLVLAAIAAVALWKNAKIYTWALNVAYEMKKVTWPTADETKYAMKVVVLTSIIVAAILFCFDFAAKWLTGFILGVN